MGTKYVITAAHCTDEGLKPEDLMVRVGDTSLAEEFEAESFTYSVASITNHPDHDIVTKQNDIAVLELSTPVPLDKYPHIKPACLPEERIHLIFICFSIDFSINFDPTNPHSLY